ncbi:MAG: DNA-3-methyladenine glycosylase I [Candidatus Cybelea sp.]
MQALRIVTLSGVEGGQTKNNAMQRCPWARTEPMIAYHDREWGVPSHDESTLFEFLVLEGAQAGLSWETILRKRDRYRELFRGFDPSLVARITPARVEKLMQDPGIVRNRAKIESTVGNAKALLKVRDEFGSADAYLWSFVDGRPIVNHWRRMRDVPASTDRSEAMSRDLRKRGFRFVGPTICYAFMQAVGMVNDHLVDCAWHDRVGK